MLKYKYPCDYVQGKCKRRKCDRYKSCTKNAKKNLEAWIRAFETNKREAFDKLMRGDL